MRLIIIILKKIANEQDIQMIFSDYGDKPQTDIACPFKYINKYLCSYTITIIIGLIILWLFSN